MKALEFPPAPTIRDGLKSVLDYVAPFRAMWPTFRVRLFAVHVEDSWRVALMQWQASFTNRSESVVRSATQRYSISFDGWIGASQAWQVLRQIETEGQTSWRMPSTPEGTLITLPTSPGSCSGGSLPRELGARFGRRHELPFPDASAPWRLAWADFSAPYQHDGADQRAWEQANDLAAQEHGFGSFQTLANEMPELRDGATARVGLEFPLALEVGRLRTEPNQSRWELRCCDPITPDTVVVNATSETLWAEQLPVLTTCKGAVLDDWCERATFGVPRSASHLILSFRSTTEEADLSNVRLRYPVSELPESRAAIGAVLFGNESAWATTLLEGKGQEFEVALANALSRLKVPVLYGGVVTQSRGCDLVAIHPYEPKRMTIISCKGGKNGLEYGDTRHLLEAATRVRGLMPGWTVNTLAVTNLADEELQASRPTRARDVPVYGRTDLDRLWDAETLAEAVQWVWPPPSPEGDVRQWDLTELHNSWCR